MSLKYLLNLHHFSSISRRLSVNARHFLKKTWELSQKTSEFFQKTWEIFRKTLDIFRKTLEFFSALSERRFLTANRNTKKAGNGRAASLEVQPLIARIDNFQAWTHNYNITREKKVIKMQGWKGDDRSPKSRHTCEIGLFTLEQT